MTQLLSLSYWFTQTAVGFSLAVHVGLLVIFAASAVLAFLLRIASKRSLRDMYFRRAFAMAGNGLAVLSVLGFFWLFCSYEDIQLFGVRGWLLVWAVALLVVLVRAARFLKVTAPRLRLEHQSQAAANKYLPRRNR